MWNGSAKKRQHVKLSLLSLDKKNKTSLQYSDISPKSTQAFKYLRAASHCPSVPRNRANGVSCFTIKHYGGNVHSTSNICLPDESVKSKNLAVNV